MEFKLVKRVIKDHIAFLSLARADRLNAVNHELALEILESFKALDKEDDARVVILKSDARIFCAGLDLKSAMEGGLGEGSGSQTGSGGSGHTLLDC